jgi:hypothetical protein
MSAELIIGVMVAAPVVIGLYFASQRKAPVRASVPAAVEANSTKPPLPDPEGFEKWLRENFIFKEMSDRSGATWHYLYYRHDEKADWKPYHEDGKQYRTKQEARDWLEYLWRKGGINTRWVKFDA